MPWKVLLILLMSQKLQAVQCALFLLLNILDGYTTWLVMKPDHYERERNPIARLIFRTLRAPGSIILFKAFLLSWLGVFIAYWWMESLTINLGLLIGNLLYIFVVFHNRKVHKKYAEQDRQLEKYLHYTAISE